MPDTAPKPNPAITPLLTIPQASEVLQVSARTVRRCINRGELIAHRFGRQWRISQADLEAFIRMRRQA
jgi:excisionase family DNA binding protein